MVVVVVGCFEVRETSRQPRRDMSTVEAHEEETTTCSTRSMEGAGFGLQLIAAGSTIQYSTVQYCTVLYCTVQYASRDNGGMMAECTSLGRHPLHGHDYDPAVDLLLHPTVILVKLSP